MAPLRCKQSSDFDRDTSCVTLQGHTEAMRHRSHLARRLHDHEVLIFLTSAQAHVATWWHGCCTTINGAEKAKHLFFCLKNNNHSLHCSFKINEDFQRSLPPLCHNEYGLLRNSYTEQYKLKSLLQRTTFLTAQKANPAFFHCHLMHFSLILSYSFFCTVSNHLPNWLIITLKKLHAQQGKSGTASTTVRPMSLPLYIFISYANTDPMEPVIIHQETVSKQ